MNSKEHRWYHKTLSGQVSVEARQLLENYSRIPQDKIDAHICRIRDICWDTAPFPCVGQFKFLALNLYRHPKYATILRHVKDGAKLLDLGCCVGQDIRKLIYDGAPSENLYGSDLFAGFLDAGYQLFNDRDTCKAVFFEADVFDNKSGLSDLNGKLDLVHTGLFFHLFDWQRQLKVANRIMRLLKAQPGSMILGSQVGAPVASERILRVNSSTGEKRVAYLHDPESFERFWREVEVLVGTSLLVEVTAVSRRTENRMNTNEDVNKEQDDSYFGLDITWLKFSIQRT